MILIRKYGISLPSERQTGRIRGAREPSFVLQISTLNKFACLTQSAQTHTFTHAHILPHVSNTHAQTPPTYLPGLQSF